MTLSLHQAFVTIATKDLEKAIFFYSRLLTQQPEPYIPNVYGEFNLSGLRLGIFKPKKSNLEEFNNSQNSGMSICLEVIKLEQAIEYLTQIGYPPPGNITIASHGKEVYAYDPMGNRLILHESVK